MHIEANVSTKSERVANKHDTRLVGTPFGYFDYPSLGFQNTALPIQGTYAINAYLWRAGESQSTCSDKASRLECSLVQKL